jgi:hypothetical protein
MPTDHPSAATQGTAVGVLALMACPIPVLGLAVSVLVQRAYPSDTNANTCGMIGAVLGALSTIVAALIVGFWWWLWMWSWSQVDL